jgi:hypothetical protein
MLRCQPQLVYSATLPEHLCNVQDMTNAAIQDDGMEGLELLANTANSRYLNLESETRLSMADGWSRNTDARAQANEGIAQCELPQNSC